MRSTRALLDYPSTPARASSRPGKVRRKRLVPALPAALAPMPAGAEGFRAQRLNSGRPLISKRHFIDAGVPRAGESINGPSVLQIPARLPDDERAAPDASYCLYFAHRQGRYIRLAWAEDVEDPRHLRRGWTAAEPDSQPVEILRPQRPWEGAEADPAPSKPGAGFRLDNALRDPYVLADDGRLLLSYVGGGERASGLAELIPTTAGDEEPVP